MRLVVRRSNPDIAGQYADQGSYVLTDAGRHSLVGGGSAGPDGRRRPMACTAADSPETAFIAHRRLVDIHPFNDHVDTRRRLAWR